MRRCELADFTYFGYPCCNEVWETDGDTQHRCCRVDLHDDECLCLCGQRSAVQAGEAEGKEKTE